jgi:hypothetical protein
MNSEENEDNVKIFEDNNHEFNVLNTIIQKIKSTEESASIRIDDNTPLTTSSNATKRELSKNFCIKSNVMDQHLIIILLANTLEKSKIQLFQSKKINE